MSPCQQHLLSRQWHQGQRTLRVRSAAQPALVTPFESDELRRLRLELGRVFPNTLLLEGSRLPDLHSSRHYVNLTNGLDLVPLLHDLQLPFSIVRIRSTSLEQQAFESLLLELDANLLLALALGHSCIVWDTGCRNRKTGAPRALWYGLEFIRFALNRCWCNTSSGSSLGNGGDGDGSDSSSISHNSAASNSSNNSSSRSLRAHIRGHDVSRDFEAACRSLHPSTKTRLRYYKRYVSLRVQQQGVSLAGAFRRTDRDEDVAHYVGLARQYCGPLNSIADNNSSISSTGRDASQQADPGGAVGGNSGPLLVEEAVLAEGSQLLGLEHQPGWTGSWGSGGQSVCTDAAAWNVQAYRHLAEQGIGMFTTGLSHTEFRALDCKP